MAANSEVVQLLHRHPESVLVRQDSRIQDDCVIIRLVSHGALEGLRRRHRHPRGVLDAAGHDDNVLGVLVEKLGRFHVQGVGVGIPYALIDANHPARVRSR